MPKTLLIVTDFYRPHTSGIITYIDQFINTIKSKKIKITILTTKHDKNDKELEDINKIKIIRCKPLIKISRGFYSFELISTFIKISKDFDLINLHLPLSELLPLTFFLKKNKTIITYHCLPEFSNFRFFIQLYFYFFGIFAMFRSKKIIVLSLDYFKNIFFHKFFTNNVIEIAPFVETQNFEQLNFKQNKNIKIGYLGRLSSEKGIENLIRVSNKMQSHQIQHELIIAGDDKDKRFAEYVNYLKKISFKNKSIKFIGYLSHKNKNFFYNEIDLFVLPSVNSFEAFGIVQLEAMSYGVPVLASNIKGVRTIVKKTGAGILFNNKDNEDLFNKIISFNKKKYQPEIIKANLEKNFNKKKFEKKIFDLLNFF